MNNKNKDHFLYGSIFSEIETKINRGEYLPGEKLESITEMKKKYGVGRNTVLRVLDELSLKKLIHKRVGKGCFVSSVIKPKKDDNHFMPIKRILLYITRAHGEGGTSFLRDSVIQGVSEMADKYGLELRIEFSFGIKEDNQVAFQVAPDEGVISVYNRPESHIILHQILPQHSFRCVLIDGVFPGTHSILIDNSHGMRTLIHHLYENGHRHLAFAGLFLSYSCFFNVNERAETFLSECAILGIKGTLVEEESFQDMWNLFNSDNRPTGLLFPSDTSAVKCRTFLESKGVRVPGDVSICGFDDYPQGNDFLTTYRVDYREMAKAAVRMLIKPGLTPLKLGYWQRVKGSLVMRKSIGKM